MGRLKGCYVCEEIFLMTFNYLDSRSCCFIKLSISRQKYDKLYAITRLYALTRLSALLNSTIGVLQSKTG